jgi:hypothetical protein
MFFVRRWMMKRYEKHLKWLEEQKEKEGAIAIIADTAHPHLSLTHTE